MQRTLDMRKISMMALNSTRPGRGTSLILYLGGGGDAQVFYRSPKPTGGDRSFSPKGLHLIRISVHLIILRVARGRLLFIGLVLYVMVLRLLLLLGRRALSRWALRDHQLYHKRLLLL
jgi:hypothetical protein